MWPLCIISYIFEHVLLPDSTRAEISLFKIPEFKEVSSKLNPYILNRNRPFHKEFRIQIPEHCDDNLEDLDLPVTCPDNISILLSDSGIDIFLDKV